MNNTRSYSFIKAWAALSCVALLSSAAMAASSTDGLWNDVSSDRIASKGTRATIPDRYRTSIVDIKRLAAALEKSPAERSDSAGVHLTLPMPDGSYQDFLVKSSPIMAPELAKQYKDISTYIAVSVENPAVNGRLDITPAGFHAIIFTHQGTVYIDPYQTGSNLEYIIYNKRAFNNNRETYYCAVTGEKVGASHNPLHHARAPVGTTLRTYRTAVAATGEYTAFHGGTVLAGQAAIVTTMNRVSGIYERELSVRLLLVANNSLLVYTNPVTDPYSNSNGNALLGENQANIDAVIGSANYDLGHVFGTGGGGLATLGVACNNFFKARGETGSGSPIGDAFDVDFVAHEIGHQFGGNHTFNGTTGNCGGNNRNAFTAYEPGSGSTIQAYAGICGAENLQANSDDVFHTISFDEMTAYINGPGACSINTPTGNTPPTVDAGPGYTAPSNTPLLLRSGSVTDPDAGQFLTYSWEQLDLGAASPPGTDNGTRPIFRSFAPQTTDVRFLPRMSDLMSGSATFGESLPTTTRNLTFRITARDNAAGGGGVDRRTVVHAVTTAAGPFTVSSQSTPTLWPANSIQTVTWDVANTDAAPVNCSLVDIIYSADDFVGLSGTTIALNTPNDGSASVAAPQLPGTTGRVMVVCRANNIFFNINAAPITIIANECGNSVLDTGELCDDGNVIAGDGCNETCQVETGYNCSVPVPPVPGMNALPESGFESGTPNPVWTEISSNFGTPICDAGCGAVPNSGSWFTWFGGISALEAGSVEQSFVIETTDTELKFARRLAACDSVSDYLSVNIDTNQVYFKNGANPDCGQTGYVIDTIDLATATGGPYNDGAAHTIFINSVSFSANGGLSNFFIDDVEIIRGASPAVPSSCTAVAPANDGFANAFVIGEGVFQSTLVGATVDGNASGNIQVDVWYAYTASADGLLTINTCETQEAFGMDTFISAHTNTGVAGTSANEIYANDDYLLAVGTYPASALRECDRPFITGLDSAMAFPVSSGEPILIRVSEFDPPETEFHLEVQLNPLSPDTDGDGFTDNLDNCTLIANADQRDTNGDGYGNVCDLDLNNDGVINFADIGAWVPFFNTACGDVDEDFDGSGGCNFGDYSMFLQFFLEPPGPSGVAP